MNNFLSTDSNCPEKVTSAREFVPLTLNVSSSESNFRKVEVLDVELGVGIVKAKVVDLIRFSYLAFIS